MRSFLAVRTAQKCCMLEELPKGADSIRAACLRNFLAVRTALVLYA